MSKRRRPIALARIQKRQTIEKLVNLEAADNSWTCELTRWHKREQLNIHSYNSG